MPTNLKDAIEDIYSFYSERPDLFTKADVYRVIAKDLNSLADAWWTHSYIYNLHNGVQVESVGKKMTWAIGKLHKKISKKLKPPKPKPLPHEEGWHIVRVYGKKIDVDKYTDAIPAKMRLGVMLKEIGNE